MGLPPRLFYFIDTLKGPRMSPATPTTSVLKPSQEFTYVRTYSRWIEAQKRREFFHETVDRYMNFMQEELGDIITPHFFKLGKQAILDTTVVPSMRAMWAAGPAAKVDSTTMYNCSYVVMDNLRSFSELLYILMCGTGVGFSVEKQYTDLLPKFSRRLTGNSVNIVVEDDRAGWADAYLQVLEACFQGDSFRTDVSKVRLRGTRLLTMGGRASGPEPLLDLFNFTANLFADKRKKGQYKLSPIDVLDLNNKAAEIVVVGGVRRSSEISFSDIDDWQVAEAKNGQFWNAGLSHRAMSNNSIAYNVKPDVITYTEEFLNLMKSGTGERGIFNREGAIKQMIANGRRVACDDVGGNPCMEILLRPMQFCNLSEVVVRPNDKLEDLKAKVKIAAMFGAWQSFFTDFPYLRKEWKSNCEEERLLGVSLTGIMDHPVLNNVNDKMKKWLSDMKGEAIRETERWCKRLDINMSAAITCVKPSGTVSQLVDSSSGIHARYANYYIRRYRISATDPLFRMLRDAGVPYHAEVGQEVSTAATMVLDFPFASPVNAVTRHDITAIHQLEHWKVFKYFWCEHNPSVTVYVSEDEWLKTLSWCYENFDDLCGVSFLPKTDHIYQLAPYEEITESKYNDLLSAFPKIDYSQLGKYEMEDNTEGARSYACTSGQCEL
jgi:ribonucleoside-diphosphate reductase alpha chain